MSAYWVNALKGRKLFYLLIRITYFLLFYFISSDLSYLIGFITCVNDRRQLEKGSKQ